MTREIAQPVLSIVIPVYNEEEGLEILFSRLEQFRQTLPGYEVEVVFVDDHSTDRTPAILRAACQETPGFHFLRLAANRGSHIAIFAGLEHSTGDACVFLAADLQDPPELIPDMLKRWQEGYDIVWAVRDERRGISFSEKLFANSFYFLLRHLSHVNLGPKGSDFVLMDRQVVKALRKSISATPVLMGEIAVLGFRQSQIGYVKQARQFGTSKWNIQRKLKLFADAFVAHSYFPIRFMSYIGMAVSFLGILYAILIIVLRLFGNRPTEGWASLMVVVLVIGGFQMVMLGIIGEYLWRTLEEARNRPMYNVECSSLSDSPVQTGREG